MFLLTLLHLSIVAILSLTSKNPFHQQVYVQLSRTQFLCWSIYVLSTIEPLCIPPVNKDHNFAVSIVVFVLRFKCSNASLIFKTWHIDLIFKLFLFLKNRKVSLLTVDFEPVSPRPVFKKVILTNNRAIRMSFSDNLQGPVNCTDMFDDATMTAIGGLLKLFCFIF